MDPYLNIKYFCDFQLDLAALSLKCVNVNIR